MHSILHVVSMHACSYCHSVVCVKNYMLAIATQSCQNDAIAAIAIACSMAACLK